MLSMLYLLYLFLKEATYMLDHNERFCYALKISEHTFLSFGAYPMLLNSDSIGIVPKSKQDILSVFSIYSGYPFSNKYSIYVYRCPLQDALPDFKCIYCPNKGKCVDPTSEKPYRIL